MRQFRKTFTDGLALPAEQRRPAGYLRGQHAVGQTRFAHLLAEAVLVMRSLTRERGPRNVHNPSGRSESNESGDPANGHLTTFVTGNLTRESRHAHGDCRARTVGSGQAVRRLALDQDIEGSTPPAQDTSNAVRRRLGLRKP